MGKIVNDASIFGVLFTDLKVSTGMLHELIIAKLQAYGFHIDALKLIHDYLSNRKQRVKVNDTYSAWKGIFYGVPQGSILGPLLFNIHLCNLFYFLENLDTEAMWMILQFIPLMKLKSQSSVF